MNRLQITEKKVLYFCRQYRIFEPGEHLVLGVSGGADSVCLLFIMQALHRILKVTFEVVHVNHGIRPEAGEDAKFVKDLCERLAVPFTLVEEDVPARALEWGISLEEAGRRVRRDAFFAGTEGALSRKAVVAHNGEDQAETLLFRLLRGTGVRGLSGIRPLRDGVAHPLLCLERTEIEDYLAAKGEGFRQDATNAEDHYTRNRIRHHVLAYAKKEISEGCVGSLCRTAELFAETEDYIEEMTRAAFARCGSRGEGEIALSRKALLGEHIAIRRSLIYGLLKELSPEHKDIGQVHVEAVLGILEKGVGAEVQLPYGLRGILRRGVLTLKIETE